MRPIHIQFSVIDQIINLIFWQSKNFSKLTNDRLALVGNMCAQQTDILVSVSIENVLVNLITVIPRKIDVEIRRSNALSE